MVSESTKTANKTLKLFSNVYEFITLVLLLVLFAGILVFNVVYSYRKDYADSLSIAQLELDLVGQSFDTAFAESESLALNIVLDVEQLVESGATREELQDYLDEESVKVLKDTNGACFNIYIGFEDGIISSPLPFPDDFDPTSRGWYTGALRHPGELYQTSIYQDVVTGDLCYTYASQLYEKDIVVGIDYNLNWIDEIVDNMDYYDVGDSFAIIVTSSGQIIGCSDNQYKGEMLNEVLPDYVRVLSEFISFSKDTKRSFDIDGEERTVFYSNTGNGCFFMLSVDPGVMSEEVYKHLVISSLLSVVVLIVFIGLYFYAIKKRAEAVQALENYEKANALAGTLTQKAYVDALTGVRNKGAYLENVEKFKAGDQRFSIVMFDVNFLKKVNDNYGHEKGDVYLKNACMMVCKVFTHCPVFRIGGDEFVAILTGDTIDKCGDLFTEMDRRCDEINSSKSELWEKVDIAKGAGIYNPGENIDGAEDPVDYCFKKADATMYEDKVLKKKGRE